MNQFKEKTWFEFPQARKEELTNIEWTVLWQSNYIIQRGNTLESDYLENFVAQRAIAVPIEVKEQFFELYYPDVTLGYNNKGVVIDNQYYPSDSTKDLVKGSTGCYLALVQEFCNSSNVVINQDLIFTLNLFQQGDTYIDPRRDDAIVVKIERCQSIKIKTSYLRDYLCARKMGVILYSYMQRSQNSISNPAYWEDIKKQSGDGWHSTASTQYCGDEKLRIIKLTRENTDYTEDLPSLSVNDEQDGCCEVQDGIQKRNGFYSTMGRLRINYWLPPAESSQIVCGDEEECHSAFYVEFSNKKIKGCDLNHKTGWLWFEPSVINRILDGKRSSLVWYTKETGCINFDSSTGDSLHFGVNAQGLINVLAIDVQRLDEFRRSILVGFNVQPTRGVSQELLMSQKDGKPADTKSAEYYLDFAFKCLDDAIDEKGISHILRKSEQFTILLKRVHRFRSLDDTGLLALAKDLIKIFIERLDGKVLRTLLPATYQKSEEWKESDGSIKKLAFLLDAWGYEGRTETAFLAKLNDLRQLDAHLKSEHDHVLRDTLTSIGLDCMEFSYKRGERLIYKTAESIGKLSNYIRKHCS